MKSILKTLAAAISLALMACSHGTYADEGNPDACDCNTIVVSDDEATGGCPAAVKEKKCPLFREAMVKKEQMRMEQERRKLERSVEPRYGAPK